MAPAASGFFNDDDYHEVVLFTWDESTLDVVIVPPIHPLVTYRVEAVKQSVQAWQDGIDEIGGWLSGRVVLNTFTIGDVATPTIDHVADPEVIVLLSTEPGVLGIGIPWDFFVCEFAFGESPYSLPAAFERALAGAHQHEGSPWAVFRASSCRDSTENVCFVVNTNWMMYQNGMYDLNAHEFGHCLGIGHVGDAGDFKAKKFPATDIMSYQHDPNRVHCVSTLNILAIQVAFAGVLGETPPPTESPSWRSWRVFVRQAPADYGQVSCLNPPYAPLDECQWDLIPRLNCQFVAPN
ncbi:MAG TPA: hypothetical protein VM681_09025 [Candidatus Thermoplasmatota archaeon]|nr:hypothetical protein [Candidatus Thermoplasmatota archaeon]